MSIQRKPPPLEKGGIIVAEPFMDNNYFQRSTILIAEHNESGSLGFIINKPTEVLVCDAIDGFPDFPSPIYFGGPAQTDTLYYVHTIGDKLFDSIQISKNLWWGGDYDQLLQLLRLNRIHQNQIRFFAGYAGWNPNELDDEIQEKLWILHTGQPVVASNIRQWIFDNEPQNLWSKVLRSMGKEFEIVANFPIDPNLN